MFRCKKAHAGEAPRVQEEITARSIKVVNENGDALIEMNAYDAMSVMRLKTSGNRTEQVLLVAGDTGGSGVSVTSHADKRRANELGRVDLWVNSAGKNAGRGELKLNQKLWTGW